ncbi:hypothetical protein BDZ45DRAFT_681466 [Acephala macrosclerotiorum]|nr:hypothetical protein BDZ45DRAFT_681466 [Acephala macrosclerotiorum]
MDYKRDLLYVSLGKFPRRGSSYASKINDFLTDVDEDDATEIRKIALEPPHNPFNEILQTLSTKFSKLKTCGGVTSDPCAVHPDPDAIGQWNLAPYSEAVGFEEVQLEPRNTYKSRRYNIQTGEVEEVDTHLTVEKFEERTAELRNAAKLMGIDEDWIDNLEFPALEIERAPL